MSDVLDVIARDSLTAGLLVGFTAGVVIGALVDPWLGVAAYFATGVPVWIVGARWRGETAEVEDA